MAQNKKMEKFNQLVKKAKEIEKKASQRIIDFIENDTILDNEIFLEGRWYQIVN